MAKTTSNTTRCIFNSTKLPKRVNEGDSLEVLLAPYGEYPNGDVVQKIDEQAVDTLVANFKDEVLVDRDHKSCDGSDTEAMAWITSIYKTDEGLKGIMRFTDVGANAISARRYRYLSPAWTIDEDIRPVELISVGCTNLPNLPMTKILNSKKDISMDNIIENATEMLQNADVKDDIREDIQQAVNEQQVIEETPAEAQTEIADAEVVVNEDVVDEQQVIEEPEADERDSKIAELEAQIADLKAQNEKLIADNEKLIAEKLDKEADEFVEQNCDVMDDKAELKNMYLNNRELTIRFCANARKTIAKMIGNSVKPSKKVIDISNAKQTATTSVNSILSNCKSPEERLEKLAKIAFS